MKRFYKEVALAPGADGYGIALDGRPVRTPARALLALPTQALGHAVAEEWRAQVEEIDPASMVMTGLANAAIDQIAPNHASFAAGVAAYGETDLLCYRAEAPAPLVARQAGEWQPLLDWAGQRYDVAFAVTQGIVHVAQPQATVKRLSQAVAACDAFTLAGLSTLVSISGSLVIGLAAIEDAFAPDALWLASELDERWQAELWGEDAEALGRRERRGAEFTRAAAFCALVRG
ncbi:ATP12 family protein [Sphingobium subterraneum]|uniref:Chaperone required for assembly of F1-ATPase n=1 Tax=Sphingobium subterraneum TaxID=627688 RepID=A0A841J6Q3_9SPHN|nr:chaperone required for assembly of F1-ATPase [Sphingobium subterraneum]